MRTENPSYEFFKSVAHAICGGDEIRRETGSSGC